MQTSISSPDRERAVIRAFEDAGAVAPASARPLDEIPGVDQSALVSLAVRGTIREAAPRLYYLFPGTEHARRTLMLRVLVVLALLVIPVLVIQFWP